MGQLFCRFGVLSMLVKKKKLKQLTVSLVGEIYMF